MIHQGTGARRVPFQDLNITLQQQPNQGSKAGYLNQNLRI